MEGLNRKKKAYRHISFDVVIILKKYISVYSIAQKKWRLWHIVLNSLRGDTFLAPFIT